MINSAKDSMEKIWEKRWSGSDKGKITFLGKLMLSSKQKFLEKVLREINFKTAIDVGCAMGYTLAVIEKFSKKSIGIDISKSAVEACKKKGLNAFEKDLNEITEKYDLVFSDGMLEHFLNFEPYAKKMAEISSRYVIIMQTDHQSFLGKTSIYFAELLRGGKNVFEYNYRMEDFISVFQKYGAGLKSQKSFFGGIFQLLIFKKND